MDKARIIGLLVLCSAGLLIPGLGAVHLFDWDEVNFAEIAREMLASGDLWRPQMGFRPFHEKPPLFMWMQAACMSVFGVGEFAARLPNALCGAITLPLLFLIGSRERSHTFGLLWVMAYIGSVLPHLYLHSGLIDPWFNLFIFLALYAAIRCIREQRAVWAAACGLLFGLATLTKGPVAPLVGGLTLCTYWVFARFGRLISWRYSSIALACFTTVVAAWFGTDYLRNGPAFTVAFIDRQVTMFTQEDAGHGGFFGYHFVVLLVGCFPASLFALQELIRPTRETGTRADMRAWMLILFWVVLLLFSAVSTKIMHYSSLCYFPLTYLATLQLERVWERRESFGWVRFALGALGTALALFVCAIPLVAMHVEVLEQWIEFDAFTRGNLEANVVWTGWEVLAGTVLLAALIAAHLLHARSRYRYSLLLSFIGTLAFVWCTLFFFVDRIEAYSQRAAVAFFSSKSSERCWVLTKGYKSYVPEFYGRINEAQPEKDVLCTGAIDRKVYLACKVTRVDEVLALGTFREIERRNGFVFFQRDP
jgi:4-amino-4-deoxy-L-arabinose transferase-like glycosyltransferase